MNAADFPRLPLAESVARLESMPRFLEDALAAARPGDLAASPGDGLFSLVEHACHLRDLEREGYLVRVRRMLTESKPALAGFDGGAIAAQRDYPSQDGFAAARDFAAARRELVALVAPLTREQLALEGTFGDRPVCFADVVAMMVEHDRGHREEIEQLADFLARRA
jgi:DinB family protein